MNETIVCPDCQSQLVLPSMPAGQTVQCPRCERVFAPMPLRAPVAAPRRADRYDDEADDVEPSAARLTRAEPLVGEWKATVAMIALAASVLSYGLQIYVGYERIELIQTQIDLEDDNVRLPGNMMMGRRMPVVVDRRVEALRERAERWQKIAGWATLLSHLTFWPAAVLVLIWLGQATKATHSLQAEGFLHMPVHAVVCCFVPIMNFFWPHRIMQDIWCASDPQAISTPRSWANVPRTLLIRAWWLAWLAYVVLAFLNNRWASDFHQHQFFVDIELPLPFVGRPREAIDLAWWSASASLCAIIAGVLLIGIIRAIARRQRERYVRLYEDPA